MNSKVMVTLRKRPEYLLKYGGEGVISERQVRRWFEKFRSGDMSLEDKDGRGRLSELDDEELKQLVESNSAQTVRVLAAHMQVSTNTIDRHLHIIGKAKKLDQWVPHIQNDSHTLRRLKICTSLLNRNDKAGFLNLIVTCGEKWLLYNNKYQHSRWLNKDERPAKFHKQDLCDSPI